MSRRIPRIERRHVLYVEDHPVNVMLMQVLFDRLPHLELNVAVSCADALCIAPGLQPVLLLLDLSLPDGHGGDLLPSLRRLDGYRDVPAVAVTAEHEFVVEGSGFFELWRKPMDLTRVQARLRELTGRNDASPLWATPAASSPRASGLPAFGATLGATRPLAVGDLPPHATGA